MANADSGIGWAALGSGALILYSAIRGFSILKGAENLVQGKSAGDGQNASLISAGDGATNSGTPDGPISPGARSAQRWAKAHLIDYGWGKDQWPSLLKLWNGESGWRVDAFNDKSGATGIPQALPGSKMASAGPDWKTNPVTQMRWGLGYIRDRYGSPKAAYAFWLSQDPHWY